MVIESSTLVGVLVSVVATMALGMFWYSSIGFGNTWIKLQGWSAKSVAASKKKAEKEGMGLTWLYAIISTAVQMSILTYMLAPATAVAQAHYVVLVVWLGFVATTQFSSYLWEGKSIKLFLFNTAYSLVSLLMSATIIYYIA